MQLPRLAVKDLQRTERLVAMNKVSEFRLPGTSRGPTHTRNSPCLACSYENSQAHPYVNEWSGSPPKRIILLNLVILLHVLAEVAVVD